MDVTVRRSGPRRYGLDVHRPSFPDLTMEPAPGFDPDLPHDLVHFVVEAELGLTRGVFGQLAAGGDAGTFRRAGPPAEGPRNARRARRRDRKRGDQLGARGHPDMELSERAAVICEQAWQLRSPRADRRAEARGMESYVRRVQAACSEEEMRALSPALIDRVCMRLDELSARWKRLEVGDSMTLSWSAGGGE